MPTSRASVRQTANNRSGILPCSRPEPFILPQGLRLNGALDARAVPGAEAVLDGVTVNNAGWVLEPLPGDDGEDPPPLPRLPNPGKHIKVDVLPSLP